MTRSQPKPSVLVGKILKIAKRQIAQRNWRQFERYLAHYYHYLDPVVLAEMPAQLAADIAVQHWQLAQLRSRNRPLLEVRKASGSAHTVIAVVTDNMPFLFDSVRMLLNGLGLTINLAIHPFFDVERDQQGNLKSIAVPNESDSGIPESFIYILVDHIFEDDKLADIKQRLLAVLKDVRCAVRDWQKIRKQLHSQIADLQEAKASAFIAKIKIEEAHEFLHWLDQQNFTFLGYQHYSVKRNEHGFVFTPVPGTALGVMRNNAFSTEDYIVGSALENENQLDSLLITKSVQRSTVHRSGFLDYIIVRQFDQQGELTAENRFVGLYTSMAYRRHPREVPVVKRKINAVFAQSGFDPVSHIGKAFWHVLETFPRDELFQIDEADLFNTAQAILHLGDRQKLKLFIREDKLKRFISCLVYVPRDHYDTDLRLRMSAVIRLALAADEIDFSVRLTDDKFARIEFFIRTDSKDFPDYNAAELEKVLEQLSHSWLDELRQVLLERYTEQQYAEVLKQFENAFPVAYQQDFPAAQAVDDIDKLQNLNDDNSLLVSLCQSAEGQLRFKLYKYGEPVAPSDSLPILENMGVKVSQEKPYRVSMDDDKARWIHAHRLECKVRGTTFDQFKTDFEDIFAMAWFGYIENDGFNALGLLASLAAREISLLRAYCKYLLQSSLTFSQAYMEQCLIRYANIAASIVELFQHRFDPALQDDKTPKRLQRLERKIQRALDKVSSLDDDRILRNYLGLVLATVRTNFYCDRKSYISFKFDTGKVLELPEPRPMFEIFIYSPRVEGVHLRSGKVARGGLRWSDRREDFRTEVLGLVKAQKVKNAVIVPTGAKGGFVIKRPPANGDRDAFLNEGIACYREFISGLLDVTDNLKKGKAIPPRNVIRYDEDDSYLVVAADKGTATFSDIANQVAEEYGFWLGDAFASGGSKGYDHKKMGITARGAWESVKLLFRDLGKDIQAQPFTVIGIGDMGGDVFGNGMLLSRQIKLVAAFNHLHIFLDPNPDPATSYKERKRLFGLPRSSWEDYNPELISRGGGVFLRSAKSITLSKAVQKRLGLEKKALTPNELIKVILRAPVELLWNGGIGTYVKAGYEQDAVVGDRSNDAVRIGASELRCQVVGEGGNLGLTQAARIEYSLQGGLIDSDFIHNAAGVNCSDYEVNIKILLRQAMQSGLLNENQRVKLLEAMTDEVAELVLQSNYWQGQAVTLIAASAAQLFEEHSRFMRKLESTGQLQRDLEGLPDDEQLTERKAMGKGLTRPEIAVLVSYSKIITEAALVDSDLWNDAYFTDELLRYFPDALRQRFSELITKHPLRCEVLATFIANRIVNRMGCTFIYRLEEETGASPVDIARAYTIAWEVFGLRSMWTQIAVLDNKIPADAQINMMLEAIRLIERASKWLLHHRKRLLSVRKVIADYSKGAQVLIEQLPEMLLFSEDAIIQSNLQQYVAQGVAPELASKVVAMDGWYCTFDVVDISKKMKLPMDLVMETYFALAAYLDIYWLRVKLGEDVSDSHWHELANSSHLDDLYRLLGQLTREVLSISTRAEKPQQLIERWCQQNSIAVDRWMQLAQELRAVEQHDLAMFTVALRELQNLYRASNINR